MTGPLGPLAETPNSSVAARRVVFTLAGERFALPIETVEAIAALPPLARVPHAAPALLGAGHLGGQIVPIVDLGRLLGRSAAAQGCGGGGEIVRLHLGGGSVGLWVDKVERVIDGEPAPGGPGDAQLLDPAALLTGWLDAPRLAAVVQQPVGEIAQLAAEAPARPPAPAFIVVETGGEPVSLPREAIQELVETVAWTPVPRAPEGFLGVGLLRGAALPVLSLATLLGRRSGATPGGFVRIDLGGRRALLAVDRIVGLRFQSQGEAAAPLDVAAAVPDELRRIVLGFSPDGEADRVGDAFVSAQSSAYLAFTVAGLDCAVAAERVDRIVGPQSLIRLPRPSATDANGAVRLEGAIELRGQVLPVAALRVRLGLARTAAEQPPCEPQAYVILRGAQGLGAIGVDQARRLVELRPEEIVPAPADDRTVVAGVAALGEGRLLRIIAADRLWSGA